MRYPAYRRSKPSGVEWLGDVPEHWEVKRLKTEADYWVSNVDKVPSDDELPVRLCNYTDVYYNERIRHDMGLMETTATADEIRRFRLAEGDVLITKDSEEWSDIAVPALVTEAAPDLLCGYHLATVRPRPLGLLGAFLLRAFQSCAVNQQFQVAATGVTRYGLSKSAIGEAWLPLPPREEQRGIADFLDAQTAKLDTLVAKKRTLVAKLKEKRTALIVRTATRGLPPDAARAAGLDPHTKLKPSGVDWLSDVPGHWEIKKGRFIGTLLGSVSPPEDYFTEAEDGIPYTKVDDLNQVDSSLLLLETKAHVRGISGQRRKIILFPKRGAAIFTNKVVIADGLFLFDSNLMGWQIDPSHDTKFVAYCLIARRLDDLADVSTVPQINNKHIYPAEFPSPPLREQRIIADYLDAETAKIDQMVAKVEAAIERLQEYRAALITAAVTGKIDVRGVGD
ncbi:MAG: restriction endonuclease subunit S [Gemmatimonadaceae bacterium]